jgi:hypothetical protein
MDVVEGYLGSWLDVDAGADAIDYASGTGANVVLIGQAKTRAEPYDWPPGELAAIIRRLVAEDQGGTARIEFVTDGQLSPESASKFVDAVNRAGEGDATDEDWEYLAGHQLTPRMAPALRRVAVITRYDSPPALLDRAVRRLRALADLTAAISDDEAELRVLRLLQRIDACGSSAAGADSRLTREEIAAVLGLRLHVIDTAMPWSDEVADEYRQRIQALPSMDELVELQAQPQALTPTVSAIDALTDEVPLATPARKQVLDLLDRDCLIVGPAGSGKSRSMDMLRRRAAEVGLVPVLLAPRTYSAGALASTVGAAVSRLLRRVLAPATGQLLLGSQETVLIIDGASELADPQMRRALARDLEELQAQLHQPTVIVSGRSVGGLRPLDMPAYRLRELDRELREEIAQPQFGEHSRVIVTELERALGGTVGNPLLFTMALELVAAGHEVTSVASVYAGFVDRLAQNAGVPDELQSALGVVGTACAELVAEGRFSLDRWAWLTKLERASETLTARGLVGSDVTAVGVLDIMASIGLFVADEDLTGYSLWHDSFRDWLAAEAIRNDIVTAPSELDRGWSTVAGHLAEAGRSDERFLHACAADLIVCATAAARERSSPADLANKATLVFRELVARHLAVGHAAALAGARVVVAETEQGIAAYLLAQDAADADDARAGAQFGHGAGPLRIAVTHFEQLLRAFVEPRPARPHRAPDEPTALARAIEEHFVARREAMRRVLAETVPTLTEAVEEHLGWRGLRATLSPRSAEGIGGAGFSLNYTYDADSVSVVVSDEPTREPRSSTLAEDFIRESPERAASTAVTQALTSLLPGFGRL